MRAMGMPVTIAVVLAVLTGCASTPTKPQGGNPNTVAFHRPLDATRKAATDAMVVLGFDVTKSEPAYLEGARPRKVGLFVGSGGETIGIWLEPIAPERTRVSVSTAKSFVGIAGQRTWDDQIITEMEKALGSREPL